MEAKKGEIKYYHESGAIFKVEVLDARRADYGDTHGEEYRLKVLEVIDANRFTPPEKKLEFCVWRAENSGGYAGWSLLDR